MTLEKKMPLLQLDGATIAPGSETQQLAYDEAEDTARQMVVDGIAYNTTLFKKAATRATDRYRLGADFRSKSDEEMRDILYALECRHLEQIDGTEAGSKGRWLLVAELAAYIDTIRGIDYQQIADTYENLVPEIRKQGAHVGWLAAINRSALLVCDDLGIEKPGGSKKANRKTSSAVFEQGSVGALKRMLDDIDEQGKIDTATRRALESHLGIGKRGDDLSNAMKELLLRQLGDDIELRKEALRTTKRLTQDIRYSGLLELLTGNSDRKPGELETLLKNPSLQIRAAKEQTEPKEIVCAMLETDLHWLTDITVRRETPTTSFEYRKRNGLA